MATTKFLPDREPELVTWMGTFKTQIIANPTAVGLTALQATNFGVLSDEFVANYNICNNDSTNSRAAVATKNSAMKAAIANARLLAGIIQKFPGTTTADRIALGLTVPIVPAPVPVPSAIPSIDILGVVDKTVKVKIHNGTTTKRGRPAGVAGAFVYSFVGDTAPADMTAWIFQGCSTKTKFDVVLVGTVLPFAKVWLTAQWINPRKQPGPACTPRDEYCSRPKRKI